MCKCNPNVRTPFCGKGDCQWPHKKNKKTKSKIKMTNDDYFIYRLTGTLEGISNCISITSEVKYHKCITCEGSKRLIDDLILELREIIKEKND